MNKLKNSSLSLFAFHLRHSIEQNPENEVEENADKIWQNLAALSHPLKISDLAILPQKLICYHDGKYTPTAENNLGDDEFLKLLKPGETDSFGNVDRPDGLILESLISAAYRLHDTYAAELNLTCAGAIETSQLQEVFNPNNCLLPSKIEASLGQTVLLLTEPVGGIKDEEKLAEDCAKNLLQNINLQLRSQCELFGSPIFEYDNGELDPIKSCHVLIWLNTAPKTLDLAIENSGSLLLLLCLHHKILHSYHQSRQSNQKARKLYSQQEAHVKTITKFVAGSQEAIDKFEILLPILPVQGFEYAKNTRNLEDYLTVIEINNENYQNILTKLTEDERDFFRQMSSRSNKYQRQIKADLRYLEPGQKLFDRAIESIRGIVAIEQVKSDRNLQTTIAVVGAGIGVAGVVAASTPYLIKQEPGVISINNPFSFYAFATFILIIVLSVGAGVITWKVSESLINWKRNKKKNQASLSPGKGTDMSSIFQPKEEDRSHASKNS